MKEIAPPELWVAVIPPTVLARPVAVTGVLLDGQIETRCPLCDKWLNPAPSTCPACGLALDWSNYRNRRRATWNAIKDWLLNVITYEEPPSPDEAVEAGEALLQQAGDEIDGADWLLETSGDKPLRWLLNRWDWLRRNQ
jgi:hypothetical protein